MIVVAGVIAGINSVNCKFRQSSLCGVRFETSDGDPVTAVFIVVKLVGLTRGHRA